MHGMRYQFAAHSASGSTAFYRHLIPKKLIPCRGLLTKCFRSPLVASEVFSCMCLICLDPYIFT